ncbi:MAG: DMT family transporter [Deltaproteobacteria bacterium]|nr:DMT family transporter [Deltaproteobacteria bacterium]
MNADMVKIFFFLRGWKGSMAKREQLKTYGALVATTVFWGLSFVATKVALETIPTFTLIFARFMLAFLFFAAIMIRHGVPSFTPKDHLKLFLMAIFEPGLYFLCETNGLLYTSAAKVSLIIATIPIAVMILSAIILHCFWGRALGGFLYCERTKPRQAVFFKGDYQYAVFLRGCFLRARPLPGYSNALLGGDQLALPCSAVIPDNFCHGGRFFLL